MTPATHTLLIGLNFICQFEYESLSPDLAWLVVGLVGLSSLWVHVHTYTHDNRTCKEWDVIG